MNQKQATLRVKGYADFTSPEQSRTGGLALDFKRTRGGVEAGFKIPEHMAGWISTDYAAAHPGPSIDTALQTAMGFAAIAEFKMSALMRSFNVDYLNDAKVGENFKVEASVRGKRGGADTRSVVMQASMVNENGDLIATATAPFDLKSVSELKNMAACRPADLANFEQVLQNL